MNLNENKRCENFDISNDIEIFNLFNDFTQDLFKIQEGGINGEKRTVMPNFRALFNDDSEPTQEELQEEQYGFSEIKIQWD